jgi:hypothetical protein
MKKTPLRRISKARAADYRLYLKERDDFLAQNQFCEFPASDEIPFIGCFEHSSQVHHAAGRRGTFLRDQKHWWPLCTYHHTWVHSHMKQARKMKLILYV